MVTNSSKQINEVSRMLMQLVNKFDLVLMISRIQLTLIPFYAAYRIHWSFRC
jgi:hypothetical protein